MKRIIIVTIAGIIFSASLTSIFLWAFFNISWWDTTDLTLGVDFLRASLMIIFHFLTLVIPYWTLEDYIKTTA